MASHPPSGGDPHSRLLFSPTGSGPHDHPLSHLQEVVRLQGRPSSLRKWSVPHVLPPSTGLKGQDTHALLQGVAEGLLQGRHTAGHIWRVRKLGGPVHEVIHRRPSWVPVGEVEVPMALVVVACRKDVGVTGEGLSWGKVELLSDGS